jgi:hypothetical protein
MMNFANFSNDELRAEVLQLARQERQATAALIRCLMEVDARRLYLANGYSSLFTFCTQVLHLSEHAALGRIELARAARRLPALVFHLEQGFITRWGDSSAHRSRNACLLLGRAPSTRSGATCLLGRGDPPRGTCGKS